MNKFYKSLAGLAIVGSSYLVSGCDLIDELRGDHEWTFDDAEAMNDLMNASMGDMLIALDKLLVSLNEYAALLDSQNVADNQYKTLDSEVLPKAVYFKGRLNDIKALPTISINTALERQRATSDQYSTISSDNDYDLN